MKIKKLLLSCILLSGLSSIFCQTSRPIISGINCIAKDSSSIKISWELPKQSNPQIKEIYIFQDTKQITTRAQIELLEPVATVDGNSLNCIIEQKDKKDYFYCVLCLTDKGLYNVILPSVNSTVSGIQGATEKIEEQTIIVPQIDNELQKQSIDASERLRDIPLPTPGIIEITKSPKNILGSKAMEVAKELSSKKKSNTNKITKLFVFEEDLICPESGDDYYLFKVLKNSFVKKDFAKAIVDLTDFLSIHRTESVTKRALFYLGESFYFSKNYQQAVFEFLKVQDEFPALSKKWIDSSLDLLTIQ